MLFFIYSGFGALGSAAEEVRARWRLPGSRAASAWAHRAAPRRATLSHAALPWLQVKQVRHLPLALMGTVGISGLVSAETTAVPPLLFTPGTWRGLPCQAGLASPDSRQRGVATQPPPCVLANPPTLLCLVAPRCRSTCCLASPWR